MKTPSLRLGLLVAFGIVLASLVPRLERTLSVRRPVQAVAPTLAADASALRPAPGRWRLAPMRDLEHVLLPLSHILIRHQNADTGFSALGDPTEAEWLAAITPKATRTREQALQLAEQLAEQLRRDPDAFESLAARHSEDLATRALAGRMGALSAMPMHPVMLDALADLSAGQVSTLVESSYGFHLWKLHAPPPRERVSGERLVLPYAGSAGAAPADPDGAELPSREHALALAHEIARRAREQASAFLSIGQAQARVLDTLRSGPIGVWSTHDASADRAGAERELDVLARLPVDGISEPLDSPYGIELLRRTAQGTALSYAYQGLFFRFDPSAAEGSERSRSHAIGLARAAIDELARSPERLTELQAQYCCKQSIQWAAGFASAPLSALIARLELGEIAPEPYVADSYVTVVRRVAPTPSAPVLASAFELPRPAAPDLALLVEQGDGMQLAIATRELAASARLHLQLSGQSARDFDATLAQLAAVLEPSAPGPERRVLLTQGLGRLQEQLGPAQFERFSGYMNQWATSRLLRGDSAHATAAAR